MTYLKNARICIYLVMILMLVVFCKMAYAISVFPGAKGFGTDTRAAYGNGKSPTICIVDTLTSNPANSEYAIADETRNGVAVKTGAFKAFIDWDQNNKLILFEVSGTMRINDYLRIKNSYVTIAGHTAPSPGIMLRNTVLSVNGHDILIQHIRSRSGDTDKIGVDIEVRKGFLCVPKHDQARYNIVIDHCSFGWGTDGSAGFGDWLIDELHDITLSNSIISEGIHRPAPDSSKGMLSRHVIDFAVLNNLFSSNFHRNPSIYSGRTVLVNNLIYNMKDFNANIRSDEYGDKALIVSMVGNVIKSGPNSTTVSAVDKTPSIGVPVEFGSQLYLMNNISGHNKSAKNDPTDWSYIKNRTRYTDAELIRKFQVLTPPIWPKNFTAISVDDVEAHVLANAGARPADRDSVDDRLVNEVRTGKGSIKTTVPGWPILAEKTRVLSLPAYPHRDDDGDGYTNLEEWLHSFAAKVEGAGTSYIESPTELTIGNANQ